MNDKQKTNTDVIRERELSTRQTASAGRGCESITDSTVEGYEKLRTVFEHTHDGILIADVETMMFCDGNPTICRMLGYDLDELRSLSVSDIHLGEDMPFIREHFSRRSQGEDALNEGCRVVRKNGGVFLADIDAFPIAVLGRNYLVGIFRDVTEKKAAEDCRAQYNEELNTLQNASFNLIALADEENVYEKICSILHSVFAIRLVWIGIIDKETNLMKPLYWCGADAGHLSEMCVHMDDGLERLGPLGKAIQTRSAFVVNNIEGSSESHVWQESVTSRGFRSVMALPLICAKNEIFGYLSLYSEEDGFFTEDRVRIINLFANHAATAIRQHLFFEELKETNRQLNEQVELVSRSQRKWQETFDSIGDMVYITDRDFNIIRANKAFAEYHGLPVNMALNMKCYRFLHDAVKPPADCPHIVTMRTKERSAQEFIDEKTQKIFLITSFPYYLPDGELRGSICIAKDITAERENETRLFMSERLAALGQMAAGIAHEINNPLASISGCAEGLLTRFGEGHVDPTLFDRYLRIIMDEVSRCKKITADLLGFVRNPSEKRRLVDLHEIISQTVELMSLQGRLRNVEVRREFDTGTASVIAHGEELRQVLMIILTNALDSMQDKGVLTVATQVLDNAVVVKVRDSGAGISSEHLNRIFDPFFSTKASAGGTGLGLAIAKKIISEHKGEISLSSEKDQGTLVSVTLPSHQ